jgi:hypothetical protein
MPTGAGLLVSDSSYNGYYCNIDNERGYMDLNWETYQSYWVPGGSYYVYRLVGVEDMAIFFHYGYGQWLQSPIVGFNDCPLSYGNGYDYQAPEGYWWGGCGLSANVESVTCGGEPGPSFSTTLLMHCDGSSGSQTFVDSSPNPKTLYVSGGANINTEEKKFGTGSLGVYASNDFVYAYPGSSFNFGSKDFTVDFQVFETTQDGNNSWIGNTDGGGWSDGWMIWRDTANIYFQWTTDGWSSQNVSWAVLPTLNAWTHVAVMRRGSALYLYLDGVFHGERSIGTSIFSSQNIFRIGESYYGFIEPCEIDEVRIIKGAAAIDVVGDPLFISSGVASEGFMSPTFAYGASSSSSSSSSSPSSSSSSEYLTSFSSSSSSENPSSSSSSSSWSSSSRSSSSSSSSCVCFGACGYDDMVRFLAHGQMEAVGHDVNMNGSVSFAGEQRVFGKTSMKLNNNGFLTVSASPSWNLGSGDFTIDFWSYFDNFSEISSIFEIGNTTNSIRMQLEGTNSTLAIDINGSRLISGPSPFLTKNWYHVAIVRWVGILFLYVDGKEIARAGSSQLIDASSYPVYVGRSVANGSFTGYMEEFRISDIARWGEGFIRPTKSYDVDSNTKLLLHMWKAGDDSTFVNSITNSGNVKIVQGGEFSGRMSSMGRVFLTCRTLKVLILVLEISLLIGGKEEHRRQVLTQPWLVVLNRRRHGSLVTMKVGCSRSTFRVTIRISILPMVVLLVLLF